MDSDRNKVRIVGVLFLVQMVTAVLGYAVILEPMLYKDNFLAELSANAVLITFGMILEITCGACVFAIAVILFPILRQFSERVALWYVGRRLTDLVGFMVGGAFLLTLLTLGQDLVNVAAAETAHLESQARYLRGLC